ncbi:MAG TPA: ATP-binding cassette domain-containing protein, partial [Candidatus Cybelea sp.]|nr:ATP-binding cassette domain-containing protein [Candidatus Cybelea sp.]
MEPRSCGGRPLSIKRFAPRNGLINKIVHFRAKTAFCVAKRTTLYLLPSTFYLLPSVLLQASEISKSFSGLRALDRVSFDLRPGEVHALVGENGAGKSTFIKIVTGAERPDAGTIAIDGRVVPHLDPHVSRDLGIAAIYQQPSLFPHLTVAENIAMSLERGTLWRRIDADGRRRRAAELLDRIGASIAPDARVASLTMPEQQVVEIAKAVGADARIVIMDEPTASLSEREVERLFAVI